MGTNRPGRRATALVAATLLAAVLALSGCSVSGPSDGFAPNETTDAHGRAAGTEARPAALVASAIHPTVESGRARPHHVIDLAFARAAWSARGEQQEIVSVRAQPRPIG